MRRVILFLALVLSMAAFEPVGAQNNPVEQCIRGSTCNSGEVGSCTWGDKVCTFGCGPNAACFFESAGIGLVCTGLGVADPAVGAVCGVAGAAGSAGLPDCQSQVCSCHCEVLRCVGPKCGLSPPARRP